MAPTKGVANSGEPFDNLSYKGLSCAKNMVKTAAYLSYEDLGDLRRFQASHLFLEHYITFYESQYTGFKGTSVFKILDAPDSDLLELFTGDNDTPPTDAENSENTKRNNSIAKTIWTLVEECGARSLDHNE